jgi:hypothetical protein
MDVCPMVSVVVCTKVVPFLYHLYVNGGVPDTVTEKEIVVVVPAVKFWFSGCIVIDTGIHNRCTILLVTVFAPAQLVIIQ